MFYTLEQEHEGSNCPRCGLTDTFLSTFSNSRYCVKCHQLYDRTDGTRLRKQMMTFMKEKDVGPQEFELIFSEYKNLFYKKVDVACGLFNPSNKDVAHGRLIHLT
jgi:ribosomal protein S27AE